MVNEYGYLPTGVGPLGLSDGGGGVGVCTTLDCIIEKKNFKNFKNFIFRFAYIKFFTYLCTL